MVAGLLQGRIPRVEGLPAQVHPGGNPPGGDAAAEGAGGEHPGGGPADPPARPQPRGSLHDLPSRRRGSELRRLSAAAGLPSAARASILSKNSAAPSAIAARAAPPPSPTRTATCRIGIEPMLPAAIHPGLMRPVPSRRRTIPRAPELARGQQVFEDSGCRGCHKLGGVGGTIGPELDKVGARRSPGLAEATLSCACRRHARLRDAAAEILRGRSRGDHALHAQPDRRDRARATTPR